MHHVPGQGAQDIDVEMGEMESNMDPTLMSFQASAIIAACAAVLIGNAFVCALNCTEKHRRSYVRLVMVSAGMNIVAALLCMPLMASSLIQAEWKFGYVLCKMSGIVCFASMITTMLFCAMAALCKCFAYVNLNRKRGMVIITDRDFIVVWCVFAFVVMSLIMLSLLVDLTGIRVDTQRTLCRYANSPNLTGYRMFYVVYSILLTFADLVLVVPFSQPS